MGKTSEQTVNINEVSRISSGTFVKGEIASQNDIRIDGSFEGNLYSKGRVVIGENVVIKGEIICQNADLWGEFSGELHATDTLSLKAGCKMTGNVHVRRLQVELGSVFNGNCNMLSAEELDSVSAGLDKKLASVQQEKE